MGSEGTQRERNQRGEKVGNGGEGGGWFIA